MGARILSVEGLAKKFCRDLRRSLLYGAQDIGRELIGRGGHDGAPRRGEFWALRDVSFDLEPGVALGLIGANGSGKTTLMRIIAGLIKPTAGRLRSRGRLAPLLALGAGFDPVLTGRENVLANLAILGLTRAEIAAVFDEVVDFSEVGYALEAPVQTYSSGMAARLGFACAVHARPDLLLIDEVMAVGDLAFREKCEQKLRAMRREGVAFILVNHAPQVIQSLCDRALYLRGGEVAGWGEVNEVVERYHADLHHARRERAKPEQTLLLPDNGLAIRAVRLAGRDGAELLTGENVTLEIELEARRAFASLDAIVQIIREPWQGGGDAVDAGDRVVLHLPSGPENSSGSVAQGRSSLVLDLPEIGLTPGYYQVRVRIAERGVRLAENGDLHFQVRTNGLVAHCHYFQPRRWRWE